MAKNILQVTPFMYADDLAEAVDFWRNLLGFTVRTHTAEYAYVERDGAGVRIMQNGEAYQGQRPIGRPLRYYFDVADLEAVHAELMPRLAKLPAGDVYGPVLQEYGQRELMILAPDGGVVVFGQAVRK